MEAKPAPAAERFRLPGLAWLAAAVCAFAPLSGAVKLAIGGQLSLYGLIASLAIAAGFVLIPLAAAWLAWRFLRASERLRTIVFSTVLAALTALAVWRVIHETRAREAAVSRQARALADQLVRRDDAPGTPSATDNPEADTPAKRALSDAQRAVKARLSAVQLAYDLAADAVATATFFELSGLEVADALAVRQRQLQEFARANQLLVETADLGAFYFSSELRDRGVAEATVRETVSAYRDATAKRLPQLKRLRDLDTALALAMTQFLELAAHHPGRWRRDAATGAVTFEDSAARQRHDEIRQTARVLETRRSELRQTLSGAPARR